MIHYLQYHQGIAYTILLGTIGTVLVLITIEYNKEKKNGRKTN